MYLLIQIGKATEATGARALFEPQRARASA